MPSFNTIGLLVLKTILKVFAICSHGGRLGHVTWTILYKISFCFLRILENLTLIDQAVLEKKSFEYYGYMYV